MTDSIIGITYPKKGVVRFRNPFSKSSAFTKGKMFSRKMGRTIWWTSKGELNFFRLLEATAEVKQYGEQPLMIEYMLNGKVHTHVPDGLVVTAGNRWLCEVKPRDKVTPEIELRTQLLERLLPTYKDAYNYQLIISEEISNPVLQKNLEMIIHLAGNFEASKCAPMIARCQKFTNLKSLCQQTGFAGYQEICCMHLAGYLRIDISSPISDASKVEIYI